MVRLSSSLSEAQEPGCWNADDRRQLQQDPVVCLGVPRRETRLRGVLLRYEGVWAVGPAIK